MSQRIRDVKFSPDGQTLALASNDGVTYLYDVDNNWELKARCEVGAPVLQCDFSVDSKWLRTADAQRNLRYFGTDSGRQQRDPSALRNCLWSTATCVFGANLLGLWGIGGNDRPRDPEQRINGSDKGILKKITLAGNEKEYALRVACSDDGELCLVDEPCTKWSDSRSVVVSVTSRWSQSARSLPLYVCVSNSHRSSTLGISTGVRSPGSYHLREIQRRCNASVDDRRD